MKKRLFAWRILGVLFIAVFGTSLHFVFALSNLWKPELIVAAVNESIREHLKMVFWRAHLPFPLPKYFYLSI
jgi:hypothetical protein